MGKRKDYAAVENLLRHVEGENFGNGSNDDMSVRSKDKGVIAVEKGKQKTVRVISNLQSP